MVPLAEKGSGRNLVSVDTGATALTIKEVELHPGYVERLHTHDVDVAVMVIAGAVQLVLGDEVRTVRAGCTMLAPPGTPHKLINNLWAPVQLLITYPSGDPAITYLE